MEQVLDIVKSLLEAVDLVFSFIDLHISVRKVFLSSYQQDIPALG